MDELLRDDRDRFVRYAGRDAEIAAGYLALVHDEIARKSLGLAKDPPTIGAMAARYTVDFWARSGIDPDRMRGNRVERSQFQDSAGRMRRRKTVVPVHPDATRLARECFHGGRNECFYFGFTPLAHYQEHDISKAYAIALCMCRVPDWGRVRQTSRVEDFRHDEMGFARARFTFPSDTRFPCLPVMRSGSHGLEFPLAGRSWACSPELELARRMGAAIEIEEAFIVPWCADEIYPFRLTLGDLIGRAEAAAANGEDLAARLFKQVGNCTYGKLGQGLAGHREYDPRTELRTEVGLSKLSSPAWRPMSPRSFGRSLARSCRASRPVSG